MTTDAVPPWISADGADTLIAVKAVPNASRSALAGALDDRLKIRVAAPPEGGRANDSIIELVATTLGVRTSQVTLERGHASAQKVLRVRGVPPGVVAASLVGDGRRRPPA